MGAVERRIGVQRWERGRNAQKRREKYTRRIDSPRPRHDASIMEPTAHGSCPREFSFYKPIQRMRSKEKNRIPGRTQVQPAGHSGISNWAHTPGAKSEVNGRILERNLETMAGGGEGRRERWRGRGTGEGQGGLKPTLTRTSFSPIKYHQVRRVSPTRALTLIRLHHCSGPEVSSNGGITAARNGYTVCPWFRYGGNGLRVLESSSNLIVACTLRNDPNVLTLGQPYGPSLRKWGIF